ncbi:MAG: DEAD/DEAH box helicase family protein [Spirochaetia bacterium]|nr:DEAD/DEAH box helicase family protein [Spirochaetia bacterium]
MYLKEYQLKVVNTLKEFLTEGKKEHAKALQAKETLNINHNWIQELYRQKKLAIKDNPVNGLGWYYPRVIFKVPTGGGKTLLAVEAIREYQERFAQKRTGLVVWVVPSEIIYSQTVAKIRDKANPLRQLIDQSSAGKTVILEKGQRLSAHDIENNLVILFVMIQSVSRKNGKEALKVFQDSGGYENFFPADHRGDLHAKLIEQFPNLDLLTEFGSIIRTSLANAIRVSRPFIIIDEIHKVFTDQARSAIDSLNPEFVLGLSATPKDNMNILVTITGLELKQEEMVKLDMHIIPPRQAEQSDWQSMIREIKKHRDKLEKHARKLQSDKGIYIRPMALIQVEATGKDQRGKGRVHSLDVKDFLVELKCNPDEVAIKTSSQNDIEDVNLFSSDCPIRYLITKEALREGWDCSYAYILGIIPNVNSDTGITQLIGRILRQPDAKKTGIKELDESYVYFSKGDTRPMLEKVASGFQNEGLEDLIGKIVIGGDAPETKTKRVNIRKDFHQFENSFYLPAWVMVDENNSKRRFSFSNDIKPLLNPGQFKLDAGFVEIIKKSLSNETKDRTVYAVTISEDKKMDFYIEGKLSNGKDSINIEYMTRRYTEISENPFLARAIATSHIENLKKALGPDVLKDHFGFITSMLFQELEKEQRIQEEKAFSSLIDTGKLVLAVATDTDSGWRVPEFDDINIDNLPNPYKFYLFQDVEISGMNSLEKKVGDILDKQSKILWWFRNKTGKEWYSIQGWRENKIRPDFVAAKKENGKVELVYVLESKGEHLQGNADSIYKKQVFDLMTNQKKQKKTKTYDQPALPFGNVSDSVEFYFIEEGNEESDIRSLF